MEEIKKKKEETVKIVFFLFYYLLSSDILSFNRNIFFGDLFHFSYLCARI